MVRLSYDWRPEFRSYPTIAADFLIQSGLASQVRFHGKRFAWFVSDVTRKDWDWLLNSCVYGNLFPTASEEENASLKEMGKRWKQYEKEGKWVYEQHAFWCTVSLLFAICSSFDTHVI
jgi:hypothetical protein